jgi:dipeptidyl aminopeptidase/acylaminoacyl peptidase
MLTSKLGIGLTLAMFAFACASEARHDATAAGPRPRTFQNGDVQLAFSLDLPEGTGPFPAVVAGHGSGRVTRQQLTWLASQWTRRGFAVLRFDKRGTGESTGTYVNVGTYDSPTVFPRLASDIVAAVRFLKRRPEIDPRRIGLAGGSQAGWILPIAARELGDVPFMVLLSGPVCSVGLEMYFSDLAENTTRPLPEVNALLPAFHGPSGFDPLPVLRQLNTPTLWLLGLDDRSIPIESTLANLKTLSAEGRPFEWRTYEGLGHELSPQIWSDVGQWLHRMVKGKR